MKKRGFLLYTPFSHFVVDGYTDIIPCKQWYTRHASFVIFTIFNTVYSPRLVLYDFLIGFNLNLTTISFLCDMRTKPRQRQNFIPGIYVALLSYYMDGYGSLVQEYFI